MPRGGASSRTQRILRRLSVESDQVGGAYSPPCIRIRGLCHSLSSHLRAGTMTDVTICDKILITEIRNRKVYGVCKDATQAIQPSSPHMRVAPKRHPALELDAFCVSVWGVQERRF